MTDTMMIRDCIRSQGMKLGHVAHVLGITNNTLRCKLENESEFKVSEAEKLSKMLQRMRISRPLPVRMHPMIPHWIHLRKSHRMI